MPQTLLAIVAMMTATLFALNQQRGIIQTRMSMMRNEVASAATGVAVDRLEEIRTMSFDEATKGGDDVALPIGLTSKTTFKDDAPPVDDVDDFDNSYVESFRVWAGDTLKFGVETTVHYAEETAPDTPVSDVLLRTKFKIATVKVYSLHIAHVDTISLSQSFACGSRCTW